MILDSTTHKARRPHQCAACHKEIRTGGCVRALATTAHRWNLSEACRATAIASKIRGVRRWHGSTVIGLNNKG